MKKIPVLTAVVLVVSICSTAMAADIGGKYNPEENSVSTDKADGYSTVIITKGTEEFNKDNIVYFSKADSTLSGIAKFLLQGESLPTGKYRITVGGNENGDVSSKVFAIGVGEEAGDLKLDRVAYVAGEGSGFATKDAVKLNDYKSVLVKTEKGVSAVDISELTDMVLTGDSDVMLGLQIDGLTDENASVYLRPSVLD